MAGLDKIIDEILSEAQAEADKTTDAAKKEADRIKAEAQAKARAESDKIASKAASDQKTIDERAKSSADMQKRQAVLIAKQDVINEIIDSAYEKVVNADIDTYFAFMEKMLKAYVQPKEGKIVLTEKDKGRMPAGFSQKVSQIASEKGGSLSLSDESRKIDGGFILIYGGIEENCSIRAIFDEKREELVDAVNSVVFPE